MSEDNSMPHAQGEFPWANQPQIVRAHQKDLIYVSTLKDRAEGVLRAWLGTRWLSRWASEVELLTKLCYYSLNSLKEMQSLGEEYVNIWPYSTTGRNFPSNRVRTLMVLLSTLPSYILARVKSRANHQTSTGRIIHAIPDAMEVVAEINLAAFYLSGKYYDVVKRILRIQHVSSLPEDPNNPPPSYSLLGILLVLRLLHRFYTFLKALNAHASQSSTAPLQTGPSEGGHAALATKSKQMPHLDGVGLPKVLETSKAEALEDADSDTRTILEISSLEAHERSGRRCALCLEERTGTTVTECGHLFCWTCIFGWGKEKAECPLCRQALSLNKLIPLYNL